MHRGRRVARASTPRRRGEYETRSGSDGERETQTGPASRPAGSTDRQGGTQGVCLRVYDSCVSLSSLREGSPGDVTRTDRETERERREMRAREEKPQSGKGTAGALENNRRLTNATRYDTPRGYPRNAANGRRRRPSRRKRDNEERRRRRR